MENKDTAYLQEAWELVKQINSREAAHKNATMSPLLKQHDFVLLTRSEYIGKKRHGKSMEPFTRVKAEPRSYYTDETYVNNIENVLIAKGRKQSELIQKKEQTVEGALQYLQLKGEAILSELDPEGLGIIGR